MSFDPRLTAARPDLAAASLRGRVAADRFIDGERFTVLADIADLKRQPRPDAALDTQLLHGETLVVYETDEEGWGWGQADRDAYVGYVAMSALGRDALPMTHRVIVERSFVYPAADMKRPVLAALPLDGRVMVEDSSGDFLKVRGRGFVFAAHLAPIDHVAADFVTIAERLIGVPYLWGGKSPQGIDCSGLVQLSCSVAGRTLPRDTDMQAGVGVAVSVDDQLHHLMRGDLVFWKGHVGIMCDDTTLLHANAYHMLVAREPLRAACERIAAATGMPIVAIRRLE